MQKHVGFAYAVKAALTDGGAGGPVATPYVMVVQHDYKFLQGFPLPKTLDMMRSNPDVLKYVLWSGQYVSVPHEPSLEIDHW